MRASLLLALALLPGPALAAPAAGPGDDRQEKQPYGLPSDSSMPSPKVIGERLGAPPPAPAWWHGAVFYEVFVRSFADSDGDGIGDFPGLTDKLDALNDGDPQTTTDLGVDALWLMPIHASPSYHGYDVTDYRSINPQYGTLRDFDRFIAAAKKRGIRVIIDFVMNHSSREHPWFIDAQRGPDAKHRDFYLWRAADPGWTQPWSKNGVWHAAGGSHYYGLFWAGMPDLNLGNPEVERELVDAMRFWLDRGVAGFRVDAARHFFESDDGVLVDRPESHAFVERVRAKLEETHPGALLVGEVWSDNAVIAPYVADGRFPLAFGFNTAGRLIEAAKDGLRAGYDQGIRDGFAERYKEAPFLTNHDMPRVMRQLGGDAGAMRIAAAALLGLPGTPFLYYGEEIGMQGGAEPRDEDKRTPMRWRAGAGHGFTSGKPWHDAAEAPGVDVASQRGKPGSLWTLYRDLIALRRLNPALRGSELEIPTIEGENRGVTAIIRRGGGQRVLVIYNFDRAPSGPISVWTTGRPRRLLEEGFSGYIHPTVERGGFALPSLAGRGFVFWELTPPDPVAAPQIDPPTDPAPGPADATPAEAAPMGGAPR
ncbi:MAG: alpha-amylase family glycosyl hydrolase [bacterium]